MKFFRNLFRHIRDAFRSFFRNGWLTIASVLTMTLTLAMIGGFVLLMGNVQKISDDIEADVQILTYIDVLASPEDEKKLEEEIKKVDNVDKVSYRTKEEELKALIETGGEEFDLFEDDANPLHNVYVVEIKDSSIIKETAEEIEKLDNVDRVNYGGLTADNILSTVENIRIVIAVIAAILVVVSILLVSNTIQTAIRVRSTEIEIMQLVGATQGFIKAPFAIEGMLSGLVGGVLSAALIYAGYGGLLKFLEGELGIVNMTFLPINPYVIGTCIVVIILGVLIGLIGALRSIKQVLEYE